VLKGSKKKNKKEKGCVDTQKQQNKRGKASNRGFLSNVPARGRLRHDGEKKKVKWLRSERERKGIGT